MNGTASLVIISTGPAVEKPGKLHFRASRGVTMPESLAWDGIPMVIPVSILGEPGKPVFVSVGLTEKANSITWNAQTARE